MPKKVVAYHKDDGPVEMYSINAREAVALHPDEWSMTPFAKAQASEPVQLLPPDEATDSENLPVIRTVQVVEREDGVPVLQIGSGHEDGKPPAGRAGFENVERLPPGIPALGEGETPEDVLRRDSREATRSGDDAAQAGAENTETQRPQDAVSQTGAGDDTPHVAKHRGRGSWSVMKGDEEVVESLTKDEAEKKADELNKG
jgi:hypothetical protein